MKKILFLIALTGGAQFFSVISNSDFSDRSPQARLDRIIQAIRSDVPGIKQQMTALASNTQGNITVGGKVAEFVLVTTGDLNKAKEKIAAGDRTGAKAILDELIAFLNGQMHGEAYYKDIIINFEGWPRTVESIIRIVNNNI